MGFYEERKVEWNVPPITVAKGNDMIDLSMEENMAIRSNGDETTDPIPPLVDNENDPASDLANQEGCQEYVIQPEVTRCGRNKTAPSRLTYEHMLTDDEDPDVAAMLTQSDEPSSYQEATTGTNSDKWKEAMKHEYNSLIKNKTWKLCSLPEGRTAVSCRWTYKLKDSLDESGKYKASLVAKGYSQEYGADYMDTYAPVIQLSSIRLLLSFALSQKLHIHEMDCKSAFLNGDLDEDMYMNQPEGLMDGRERVCKLQKQSMV